ncbi:murein L,D-transpeptidase catalytic domain family protein [Marilutibacter aestuarii]|uniref:Murein L,D-transpeptidase catalytic domain family protein n=1 Tax=Marilutibacter aestuarii TaxID=1706195 RepID=A0A507ZNC0_9GAMM|nr:murein L,D-transpeptidase catalytic domain family protein [Lysobacter aestuarii]TQD39226.1 murein L,D-transpeptidase catalytic domain family protein [Lysobacter aestuarii]
MTRSTPRCLPLLGLLALAPAAFAQPPAEASLSAALTRAAPDADPGMLTLAARSLECAQRLHPEQARPERLAVIDYSLPSTEPRMWVFDLAARRLMLVDYVAHGQGSGDNRTTAFSNRPGSHQSSIGMFRTSETYVGKNGYSLRLDGLEPGFNDRARERAIVMHGAPYVSQGTIRQMGRLGRSWGCPAVRPDIARTLIDDIKGGQYLFAYYPDPKWLHASHLFSCPATDAPTQPVAHAGGGNATARSSR